MFTSQSLPQRKGAYSDYSILICSDPVLCDYSAGGALAYICAMCPAAQQSSDPRSSIEPSREGAGPRPSAVRLVAPASLVSLASTRVRRKALSILKIFLLHPQEGSYKNRRRRRSTKPKQQQIAASLCISQDLQRCSQQQRA